MIQTVADSPRPLQNERQWRLAEVCLVLAITVLPSVFGAFYLLDLNPIYASRMMNGWQSEVGRICKELCYLALLGYILARSGRNFASLGLEFAPVDLWRGLCLSVVFVCLNGVCYFVLYYGYWFATRSVLHIHPRNLPFSGNATGLSLVLAIATVAINPFFEELTVRAYLQTEITYLTNVPLAGVLFTSVLQASYHVYQGVTTAIYYFPGFLAWAVYYARKRQAAPVVIAHMLVDGTGIAYLIIQHLR